MEIKKTLDIWNDCQDEKINTLEFSEKKWVSVDELKEVIAQLRNADNYNLMGLIHQDDLLKELGAE